MGETLYGRSEENIFAGITPTCTAAPSTSYALATFLENNPARRIRFGTGTLTLTWTLPSPALGGIFDLVMSNIDAGATVTLTNGSGLSQPITVPIASTGHVPLTAVVDLSVLTPSTTTRTSNVWHLVVSGNTANLIFGASIGLYAKSRFLGLNTTGGDSFLAEYSRKLTLAVIEHKNEYLTRYRQVLGTQERVLTAKILVSRAQAQTVEDWYRFSSGAGGTSLLWPDSAVNDALIGSWGETFEIDFIEGNYNLITMVFSELSKGKAIV